MLWLLHCDSHNCLHLIKNPQMAWTYCCVTDLRPGTALQCYIATPCCCLCHLDEQEVDPHIMGRCGKIQNPSSSGCSGCSNTPKISAVPLHLVLRAVLCLLQLSRCCLLHFLQMCLRFLLMLLQVGTGMCSFAFSFLFVPLGCTKTSWTL